MVTGFLRRLYEQTLAWSRHRRAGWALGCDIFYRKLVFPNTARCDVDSHGFGGAVEKRGAMR